MPKRRMTTRAAKVLSQNRGRMPPLNTLRAFEAAARTGSMRRAADEIGISHTVISRHVRNLEAWLRVRLLRSGPRGVTLTREGERFFATISRAFGMIVAATAELRPPIRSQALRIWCMPGLAARWLTPRFAAVQRTIPKAELTLRAIDQIPSFDAQEADVMIGFARTDIPKGAAPLVSPRMFPVASPKWIRDHGVPTSLDALARCPLIHEESRHQWTEWLELAGATLNHPLTGPRLSDANLALDAALACVGVALTSKLMAQEELAEGRLVELFKTKVHLGRYFFLASPATQQDPLTDKFYKWLTLQMSETEAGVRNC